MTTAHWAFVGDIGENKTTRNERSTQAIEPAAEAEAGAPKQQPLSAARSASTAATA